MAIESTPTIIPLHSPLRASRDLFSGVQPARPPSAAFIVRLTERATRIERYVTWAYPGDRRDSPYRSDAWVFGSPVEALHRVRLALGAQFGRYEVEILPAG